MNHNCDRHIVTLETRSSSCTATSSAPSPQREIGVDTESFHKGLRAALRQDPDVILIGEMRDAESIDIALKAAETGHLVISTLHTRDAASTISRLMASSRPRSSRSCGYAWPSAAGGGQPAPAAAQATARAARWPPR